MVKCSPGLEVDIINYLTRVLMRNINSFFVPSELGIRPGPMHDAEGGRWILSANLGAWQMVRRRALRV